MTKWAKEQATQTTQDAMDKGPTKNMYFFWKRRLSAEGSRFLIANYFEL